MCKLVNAFLLLSLVAMAQNTLALSCPEGVDPYDELQSMYSNSEFVFVGHAIEGPIRRKGQLEYSVSSVWKGPNVQSIWLDHANSDSIGQGEKRLIFASRNRYSDDEKWYDTLRYSCMPREAFANVESMLLQTVGEPYAPDPTSDSRMQMILAAAIFLGVGGMIVLLWNLIIVRKTF